MASFIEFSMGKILFLLIFILCSTFRMTDCVFASKLLVVLYDGFRWDYASLTDTPNLDKVASLGAKAHHVNPVFPSKTGPNMYSIATGQYPENHGIVGNKVYDPSILNGSIIDVFKAPIDVRTKLYANTEPIWVSAEKAGLKTACYMWPGCDLEISGYKVDFVQPNQEVADFNYLVDRAMKWFTEDDVSLAMIHFIEPDHSGHRTGPAPESQETLAMIRKLDEVTGYMLEQLGENNLLDNVNVLLMADHGMTSVSVENRSISLYDYINRSDTEIVVRDATQAYILPAEGKLEKVYNDIKDKHPRISVYYREDIPERFHYRVHHRVLPILVLADEGWIITYGNDTGSGVREVRGEHGYDNSLMSMKPFFMAMGPDISPQTEVHEFSQVDLCPLMCRLLDITPDHAGNGSSSVFEALLRSEAVDMRGWLILMTSMGMVVLVFLITIVTVVCKRRVESETAVTRLAEQDSRKYLYHKLEDT